MTGATKAPRTKTTAMTNAKRRLMSASSPLRSNGPWDRPTPGILTAPRAVGDLCNDHGAASFGQAGGQVLGTGLQARSAVLERRLVAQGAQGGRHRPLAGAGPGDLEGHLGS